MKSSVALESLHIRPLQAADLPEWVRLRASLWPDAPVPELESGCQEYLAGKRGASLPREVFVIDRGSEGAKGHRLGGFQEVSIRGAVDGCSTACVAYLEGILVDRDLRRQGWARKLVEAAELWARTQGCLEIASDVLAGNHTSHRVHLKLGYGHARPLIVLRKKLGPTQPQAVHSSLVAEPLDPSAAFSLVQDSYAPAMRLAAGVVTHRRLEGRELQSFDLTELPGAAAMLHQSAVAFHTERSLTKLAVLLRVGRVSMGEAWGVVAVSATDAALAHTAAEDFLATLAGNNPVLRSAVWRVFAHSS
jgi:aminoglycoside 6'-N-acetyltransferase I